MSSPPVAQRASTTGRSFSGSESGGGRPTTPPLSLGGFECSLETVGLDALESVARTVSRSTVAGWFERFPATEEVALLGTCHRVELVVLARYPEELHRWREVLPGAPGDWKVRNGPEVVHHLFRVAAGRESLAVGEAEVGQQVLAAGRSTLSRHPRPVVRDVFLAAVSAAQELAAGEGPDRSIASVAAAEVRSRLVRPHPRVLVVGSGVVGRQVAERLAPFARVTVVYHARPPPPSFLRPLGVEAVPLAQLSAESSTADVLVTAAKFGGRGVRVSDLPRDRPLLLIDLGMPRNVDPAVRKLPHVRLVDLQELHALSKGARPPDLDDARVEERASRCADRVERRLWEPWIDAVLRAAEATRRSELATARRFLGTLDPAQELAVDRLTRRLVARLLLPPTERVRSLPAGPAGDLRRRFALELLRSSSADP